MASRESNFKQIIIDLLTRHLSEQKPLMMEWKCDYCDKTHIGNMMKKVVSLREGGDVDGGIGLYDATGKVFAVICISKNKKFSQASSDRYQAAGAIYIELVATDDPGKALDALVKPRFVNTCLNPRCKDCGGYQLDKSMLILDSWCWKCQSPMKMAMLEGPGFCLGPEDFTTEEVALAQSKGVLLETRYSNTTQSSYLANICPHCNMFTGAFHLFDDHYIEVMYDESKYERIRQGYFCEACYQRGETS